MKASFFQDLKARCHLYIGVGHYLKVYTGNSWKLLNYLSLNNLLMFYLAKKEKLLKLKTLFWKCMVEDTAHLCSSCSGLGRGTFMRHVSMFTMWHFTGNAPRIKVHDTVHLYAACSGS